MIFFLHSLFLIEELNDVGTTNNTSLNSTATSIEDDDEGVYCENKCKKVIEDDKGIICSPTICIREIYIIGTCLT